MPNFLYLATKTSRIRRYIQPALDIFSLPKRSLLRTYYVLNSGNVAEPAHNRTTHGITPPATENVDAVAMDGQVVSACVPASQWVNTVMRTNLLTWGLIQLHHS